MAGAPMLEARITEKRLPSGEALLRDLAITVVAGETVVLLGPSGVGKTSTLRILLGLDGSFLGSLRNQARRTAPVFQEPRLLSWLTVRDNIRLVIPPGQPAPDIGAILAEVGLAGSEALLPRQLSLGMAHRVAVARALATRPDLVVLDEPFASLDPGSTDLMAQRLAGVPREGGALVMAMHDLDRALSIGTRILVMAGRPAHIVWKAEIARADGEEGRHSLRREAILACPFLASQGADDEKALLHPYRGP